YPQLPYQQAPQIVYPHVPYAPYPYPQTILPPPKLPVFERENEIGAHGYKESLDYPLEQARKERTIARIVFFSVIALLLIFFFSPLLTHVLPTTMNAFHAILITFAFEIILIVVFSLILRHAFPQGLRESLGLKKPRGTHVLIGIGSAFGALFVAFVGAIIIYALGANLEDSPQAESYANLPDWQMLIVILVCVPLIAPLLEELLFRGILVGAAVRAFPGKVGFFVAIIVTGLVFGSLHFPGTFDLLGAYVIILISSIGIALAWLRLTFNSALVTMVTHAVYNGSLVILGVIGSLAGVVTIPLFP
ncbi:MAG: CPBP family intramembrane metalloprotease, partial [Kiritimatiellae bacterium]|nr:CPBP family intramembrane metalloprotease [Kiritimatiellia bacterium]